MSAAAGALALASVAPPAATGAAPAGAAPDAAASPFEGLLAGEGDLAATGSEPQAKVDPAPADAPPAAITAVDATPPASPAGPPAPPPMDDPATSAVLNALALRVATEARAAGTSSALPAVSAQAAATATATDMAAPASASTPVAVTTLANAPAAGASLLAASISGTLPGLPTRQGAIGTAAAFPLAPAAAAASPAPGDEAGALDALLASLDALLPSGPAKAPAPNAAAPAQPAMPTPLAAPAALPATAPIASPVVAGADAASALLEGGAVDNAADPGSPANASPATTTSAGPAPAFASLLANATSTAPGAARADGGQPPIPVPFDSPQWGSELATRVVSLAKEQFSEAEIRVTPDELGPIEVKLRFDGDRVHAQFGAISPEAREALTANLHRLREMFAGEGLNLGQAFVGHHGQDAARRFDGSGARSGPKGGEDEDAPLGEVRGTTTVRRGLLDEFA